MPTYKDKLNSWSAKDVYTPRKTNSTPQLSEEEVLAWKQKNIDNFIWCHRSNTHVLKQNCGNQLVCYMQGDCERVCFSNFNHNVRVLARNTPA